MSLGCVPSEPECQISGLCIGNIIHVDEVSSLEECLKDCKSTLGCRWFSYLSPSATVQSSSCILYHDCATLDETCSECLSGERRCKVEEGTTTTDSSDTTATQSSDTTTTQSSDTTTTQSSDSTTTEGSDSTTTQSSDWTTTDSLDTTTTDSSDTTTTESSDTTTTQSSDSTTSSTTNGTSLRQFYSRKTISVH